MAGDLANPHDFWKATCGVDTYARSRDHARVDTPWNAFSREKSALVCTLWLDRIVTVRDPDEARERRFVRLGGRSRKWEGPAIAHGRDARANLEEAIKSHIPVYGYEAEAIKSALERGERKVKHIYLRRAHRLLPHIGLRAADLDERLNLEAVFRSNEIHDDIDPNMRAILFELVDENVTEVPGTLDTSCIAGNEPDDPDSLDDEVEEQSTTEEYASLALSVLIDHVLRQQDGVMSVITYKRLAELIGRRNKHGEPWARGLGRVLGAVTRSIDRATAGWTSPPPFLTTIVVRGSGAEKGLPGPGIKEVWTGYETLSRTDKVAKLNSEYVRILQYGVRWNAVLEATGHSPITDGTTALEGRGGGWGGGESDAHKALKQFVVTHPELVGADGEWRAELEYSLRSGDVVDVMFLHDDVWIAVEVKSRVSDLNVTDYERGLYQAVKYDAVLRAQARIDRIEAPPEVRVYLVLENQLPDEYCDAARELRVQYIENAMGQ